jgi:hypothetical protein
MSSALWVVDQRVVRIARIYCTDPLGTDDRKALTTEKYSCGSTNASRACDQFQRVPVTSRPALFFKIRAALRQSEHSGTRRKTSWH